MRYTEVVTEKHRRPSLNNLVSTVDITPVENLSFQLPNPSPIYNQRRASHGGLNTVTDVPIYTSVLKEFQVKTSLINQNLGKILEIRNSKISLLCASWYIISSICSNISKAILKRFPHAVVLTIMQFALVSSISLSFVILANYFHSPTYKNSQINKALKSFPDGVLPNYLDGSFRDSIWDSFLKPTKLALATTFPMGIFQFLGHITSHKSTSLIPVSLVHSIKALSPIITVVYYRFVHKKQYNTMVYCTLLLLICGVMTTCWKGSLQNKSENNESSLQNLKGLIYAFLSMLIFVSQNIFAKGILTVKKSPGILSSSSSSSSISSVSSTDLKRISFSPNQLDKLTILFYCSIMGTMLTMPAFITSELMKENNFYLDLNIELFLLILLHCVTHFIQALLAFQLIGMISPVNYSVANIMKRIVIISVALIWEAQLNVRQIFGLGLTIAGLFGYDRWGVCKKNTRN
ncbi:hypothetical protein TPHA_0I00660 [Tetrapisispora phaffii CBS 4417]|uniref:Sugar phosphate transporter domain-containing protein n=1 Tax=Tetrapisispora phaffii (strain ATCC 24235 / CBS 4417 / NBRC 1672 / NRRL Y-8282 / UCD 70-5) TaxID=1071381 RepID=G8BXE4_TETPH|nr:hypothetical protein TPHA_0I00660 [Tetrapisispora phaffii CBS 4417]CCE64572.1 hypothetical protein TPHA_0I00660 [Tetrapisispora phaffii CBS 4417]